jgi:hypothetical protein
VNLSGKAVNLQQLSGELTAAGVPHRGLGADGGGDGQGRVYTYTSDGGIADLPPEAAPVVQAHVAIPDPAVVERTAATSELRDQYAAMVTRLDALVTDATTTDTAAKVRQAVIDLARFQRRALRLLKAQIG